MRGYSNPKLKLLYLKRFFEERTDGDHPATMQQILDYLAEQGIPAERKSVYADLDYLEEFGMRLRDGDDARGRTYRLRNRDLEEEDLELILDCVASSRFLSRRKSAELQSKLEKLASVHRREELKRRITVAGQVKTMDESVLHAADIIQGAIAAGAAVRFRTFRYGPGKERIYAHGGRSEEVIPAALLFEDGRYILWAYAEDGLRSFRLDRMTEVRQGAGKGRKKSLPAAADGLPAGKTERVEMVFHNILMDTVIDRFGAEVAAEPADEYHFRVTENVEVGPAFFGWMFSLGGKAEIAGPEPVVRRMREMVLRAAGKYGKTEKPGGPEKPGRPGSIRKTGALKRPGKPAVMSR